MPILELPELIVRVLVAGGLGGLVGLDRELSDQPAGLRTHVLVALGAALFTMAGAFGVEVFLGAPQAGPIDPTRVAAQIVTGIGFLGAGAIIRQGFSVRGLTTAAGLWVTAAIGMAVGFGFYEGAVATTAAGVIALYGLKRVERLMLRRIKPDRYEFVIDAGEDLRFGSVTAVIDRFRCRVEQVRMDTSEAGERHMILHLLIPAGTEPQELAGALRRIHGVSNVNWRA
jgi:putative Mg2+ transporter-C (MgtC) family protein